MRITASSVFPLHNDTVVTLNTRPETAFAYLDDFKKLSAHMEKPAAAMMGTKMTITTDALGGRVVGSKIRMEGRVLGMMLSLDEVVTEREPPVSKAWQTVETNLLVIGHYRLGFVLSPNAQGSLLRVFIDYGLPPHGISRWLGRLFGRTYARWCTAQMANDAVAHFNT